MIRQPTICWAPWRRIVFGMDNKGCYDTTARDCDIADFMNVGVGSILTGIFNVADIGVMFGAIALVLCLSHSQDIQEGSETENDI